MGTSQEVGTYVLPIIPSIEGIGPSIDRTLGKAFGNVGKQASQALAGGVRDGIAQAEADIRKSSEAIAKLRDKEAAAADKLATAEARIEEVRARGGSALKRAEAQRNAANRAQQQALREIEQQTRSLTEAQERLAREQGNSTGSGFLAGLRGSVRAAGGAGSEAAAGFAEGFGGSAALLRLGSAGGPIGLALAAAGVVGGGLLVKSVIAGIEREPARDLVQAQLGLDEASMAKLSKAAAKAYTDNFGESAQQNISTAKAALQSGLLPSADDPGTAHVIEQLTAVSQLLGEEIPATARAAGQLIKTGLADNADQAFDLIAKGEQAGLNTSQDLLDTFNEYGTQFRKLGLSGPEAVGLLSQALKGGARDSDKAADAIKAFSIRSVDGSKTTMQAYRDLGFSAKTMSEEFAKGGPAAHEAFGQILAAIRSVDDPLKRGQVAAALFGTQWEDLGGAFDKFDLSNAVNELGKVEGAAQDAAHTMNDNVVADFESAKRSIIQSANDVQDKLADAFGPELKKVADFVHEHTDDIAQFFTTMGVLAIDGVGSLVKGVADGARAVAQLVNVVGDAAGGFLRADAAINRVLGQTELADERDRLADSMFGLADGIYDVADAADRRVKDIDKLKEGLSNTADKADDAKDKTGGLGKAIQDLPRRKDVTVNVTDGQGNPLPALGPGIGWQPSDGARGGPTSTNPSGGPGAPAAPGLPVIIPGVGGVGPGGRPTPGSGLVLPRSGLLPGQTSATPSSADTKAANRTLAQQMFGQYFPAGEWSAFDQLVMKESGYDNWAKNPNSSAFGIGQFLDTTFAEYGAGATADPGTQLDLMLRYIKNRYGTPSAALDFHNRNNWYEYGGPVFGGVRGKDSVAALLAGDEHVVTTDEVDAAGGHDTWYRLRAMARAGLLRGFENGGAVDPQVTQISQIASSFGLQFTSGRAGRETETTSYHSRGLAGDFSNGVRTDAELAFATYMATNFGGQLAELIYDDPRWSHNIKDGKDVGPFGQFYTMEQAGDHTNHVHIAVRGTGSGTNAVALGNNSLAGLFGGGGALPVQGPAGANVVSAFGSGYQAGVGTPGYNDLGEPGYYQTDPRQIAQADRRAEDARQAIADADQRIVDAKKKRADLEDEINVTAEDRAKADKEVADAERAAQRAREDAQWALEDAADARKGKFTAAKKAQQDKSGTGDLSQLGGIFGAFLKETLGIDGSLFPDLADLMPIKMGGAALSAFKGPLLGALQGQLGIQQPGWQPGTPVQVPAASGGGGGLPFGLIPNVFDVAGVGQPGMAPPGTPASGIGSGLAPGPIDQSRNVSIAVTAGPNEEQIANTVRREVASVDRLNTYAPPGMGG